VKAFDERVHMALTGMSNEQTLKNFELVFREFSTPDPNLRYSEPRRCWYRITWTWKKLSG
jgi:pyruvate-formate lyase-activating enzyme